MKKVASILLATLSLGLVLQAPDLAATKTASTGNWGSTSTWGGGAVPTSSDSVVIGSGVVVTVDVNAQAGAVTFAASSAATALRINSGISLTVSRSITMVAPNSGGRDTVNVGAGTLSASRIWMAVNSATGTRATVVTVSTGSLTVGSIQFAGSVTANQQLNVTGAGTVNVSDTLYSTGTTTLAAASTVNFNGTTNQTIPADGFGNLSIDKSAGTATLGGTSTVSGALTVTSGTLNVGNFAMTVSGDIAGAGAITSGSSTITVGGNWINSGIFTKGTGTVAYNGTSAQSVAGLSYNNLTLSGAGAKNAAGAISVGATLNNSSTLDMSTLTLTLGTTTTNTGTVRFSGASNGMPVGAGGTVEYYGSSQTVNAGTYNSLKINQATGDASLGGAATVNGTLTFTAGRLLTGANTLTIGSAGSSSGAAAGRYVLGSLSRVTGTGTKTLAFDIGGAVSYSPVSLAFTSITVSGTVTAVAAESQQPQIAGSGIDSTMDVKRYWTLSNAGTVFSSYAPTFTFVPGDIQGGASTSTFVLRKYTASSWSALGATMTSTTAAASGVTTFGDFAVGKQAFKKFAFSLSSPQIITTPFTGTNTLTAQDTLGQTITNFDASAKPVTITANSPLSGTITGLGSGSNNVLNRAADFSSGVANLTSNLVYTGTGGTGTFTATAAGGSGTSNAITVNSSGPGISQPIISRIGTSVSGAIGSSITITGQRFSTTPSNNLVKFGGGIVGTVTAATSTTLTVTVPAGASYGRLTVTVANLTAYSPNPFDVTFGYGGPVDTSMFAPSVNFTAGSAASMLDAGDLDRDGKPDLVVSNNGADGSSLSVLRNTSTKGSVSFASTQTLTTPASGRPWGVGLADFDGDGKLDIAVGNGSTNNISIFRNTSSVGSISFAGRIDSAAGLQPHDMVVADIDMDGRPDIIITDYNNGGAGTISIFRNTSTAGTISFAAHLDVAVGVGPRGLAVGDIDLDGKPDLVVTNYDGGTLTVFQNTSTPGTISLINQATVTPSAAPLSVSIADFDGDGYPDVVYNGFFDVVQVQRVQGTFTGWGSPVQYHHTYGQGSIEGVDVDGDGRADIVTSNVYEGSYNRGTLGLLRNLQSSPGPFSGSSFADTVNFTMPGLSYQSGAADIDGDGRPDLIGADYYNSTVGVMRNQSGDTLTITAVASSNGTITPLGATKVPHGGNQAYVITPNGGSHCDSVVVDGVNLSVLTGYTFTNVLGNHTIHAYFSSGTAYPITSSAGPGGTISPLGTVNVLSGGSKVYTITADAGFGVDTLYVDGVRVASAYTYTFTGVTAPHTIRAVFALLGPANKLAFIQQPVNTAAGASITPAVTVQIQDAVGHWIPTDTSTVTVAIGTNPSGGVLSGATMVKAIGGVATFSTLSINKTGVGYTLTAAATGLTGTTSAAFTIGSGAAVKLLFSQQPSAVVAGAAISPAVQITLQDANGNTATGDTSTVTMSFSSNPGAGTLSGTTAVKAVAGVAGFSNLSINKAGTGYKLKATSGAFSDSSTAFNVTVGTASKIAFLVQPVNTTAGATISPAVQVGVEDASGNVVTSDTSTTIALSFSSNPGSATLSGTTSMKVVNGVASFGNLSIAKAASGYKLLASAGSFTDSSTAFNVTPSAGTKLVFVQQPTNALAGAAITPAVRIAVEDVNGNVVTSDTSTTIAMSFSSNPGAGVLVGTTSVKVTAGVATFSNLSVNKTGIGYKLAATTGSFGDSSAAFNIMPGAAAKLAYLVQPSNVPAGLTMTPAVKVGVEDANGNIVTGDTSSTITLSFLHNPGSAVLGGTTSMKVSAGVATFSDLTVNKSGSGYKLLAGNGSFSDSSAAFDVIPSVGTKLVFLQQPSNTAAGSSITPAVKVGVQDESGNLVVVDSSTTVTLSISSNPGAGVLGGTASTKVSGGVATFSGLSINKTGTAYTLAATTGAFGDTSAAFNVTPGTAGKVAFLVQPSGVIAGASMTPAVKVAIEDANDNVVTDDTSSTITLAFLHNPGAGVLGGTTSVKVSAGVATFPDLSINKTGTGYKLTAGSGAFSDSSAAFTVTPGAAGEIAFLVQPSNVNAGAAITPAVTVGVEDANGNVVTSDTTTVVTVSLHTNPGAGVLSGTLAAKVVNGVAAFANLSINKAGSGYKLAAVSGSFSDSSSAFLVMPSSVARIVFVQQPSNAEAGAAIAPAVKVGLEDAGGNIVTNDSTTTIGLSLASNANGATLGGTTSLKVSGGVATFPDLAITRAGSGYKIVAASGAYVDTSAAIAISVGAASTAASKVTVGRSAIAPGDTTLLTLIANDAYGNRLSTGGATVIFALGPVGTSVAAIGSINDHGDGSYSATMTGITVGTPRGIVALLNGQTVTSAMPSLAVVQSSLQMSALNLNFGTVGLNVPKDSVLVLTNGGNDSLRVSNITSSNGMFAPRQKTFVIAPAGSYHDTIRLTPTSIGNVSGVLVIASNAPSSPDTVHVSAFVTGAPALAVSAAQVPFGNVRVGSARDSILTLTNTGTDTLKVTGISVSDTLAFGISVTSVTLLPSASAPLDVTFHPASAGAVNGTLILHSNSASGTDTVRLSGFGAVYSATLSWKHASFGKLKVGEVRDSVVSLTNTGNDTLRVTNIVASNPAFSLRTTAFAVAPGQTFIDTVRYAPVVPRLDTAQVLVYSNLSALPDTLRLTGFAVLYAMQVNPGTIAMPDVNLGKFRDTTIVFTNTGNDTLVVSSISVNSLSFALAKSSFILAPAESFTDTLRFTPSAVAQVSAALVVVSNAVSSPDTVKLSGSGIPALTVLQEMGLPTVFSLSQNYPNPFNPTTTVRFGLPERSTVSLIVYNAIGQEVARLLDNEERIAGYHEVQLNATNLASGAYFLRIVAGGSTGRFVQVRKMLLVK